MTGGMCHFNGINGDTGAFFQQPAQVIDILRQTLSQPSYAESEEPEPRGLAYDVNPKSLSQTGWGIIFPSGCDPQIRKNLEPLIQHRRREAGSLDARRFKVLDYNPGTPKQDFLTQQGAPNPGMPIKAHRMPYYLLIVGSPLEIQFSFQYRLATDYAVGRIYFDRPEDYAVYAESVVAHETQSRPESTTRNLTLFGVQNHDDPMTDLTTEFLVKPLAESLKNLPGWQVRQWTGEQTTKARLARLMGGDQTPDILFTVAHGLCYRPGSKNQRNRQGALVCREWGGPKAPPQSLTREKWFGAPDLEKNSNLHGLISFHLGCFTAGTPRLDALYGPNQTENQYLASEDFVAAMPQRMLAHPNGGALAVIGHVDRAWEYSFVRDRQEEQSSSFQSCLKALANGMPVGFALSSFTSRVPALAEDLLMTQINEQCSDVRRLSCWTDYHDARTYVILGDPACRVGGAGH